MPSEKEHKIKEFHKWLEQQKTNYQNTLISLKTRSMRDHFKKWCGRYPNTEEELERYIELTVCRDKDYDQRNKNRIKLVNLIIKNNIKILEKKLGYKSE